MDDLKRKEFTTNLKDYYEQGYRYLGLEMFKDNRQAELDLYVSRPDEYRDLMFNLLDKEWRYNSYSYLEMMDEAVRLGFKIIALDLPYHLLPKEVLPHPVVPELSIEMNARNKRMAMNIARILENDRLGMVLVLVGNYHAKRYGIPKFLLENHGILSTVSEK